ncbi:efflux RND transporter periplasmic adaptor subunit [Marinicella meishanensis]|uniref:efflux RND transporter periplasmic adaptor subunit n=1 Tax=Marinicella meishanensis TaxID=2873263 RepID=UPI001CBB285F|nr:efflux RND transporter periplasmic adaptor subunit [Marinicella sp. NBU2979]
MKHIPHTLTITAITLMLTACGEEPIKEEPVIRPVLYQQVNFAGGDKQRTISGTSISDQVIKLSFRSNGILSELNMTLGQKVAKGDLLGKLDNIQAQLNYENSISAKNASESRMKTAKLNLDRIKALYEKGGSSLSDLEAAKDVYRTAQQDYNSSLRNVDIQNDQINYGYLYASADGEVASVNVELNENVSAGQVVGTLNSGTQMDIALGVPESIINDIQVDMPVDVSFVSLGNQTFAGVVKELSPSIDASTSTYPVVVNVLESSSEIRSGMAANVRFTFASDNASNVEPKLLVPAKAVGEDANGQFVFLLEQQGENHVARKQAITIGALTAEGFEVTAGLSNGQLIATAGLQTLLDGQMVKLKAGQ